MMWINGQSEPAPVNCANYLTVYTNQQTERIDLSRCLVKVTGASSSPTTLRVLGEDRRPWPGGRQPQFRCAHNDGRKSLRRRRRSAGGRSDRSTTSRPQSAGQRHVSPSAAHSSAFWCLRAHAVSKQKKPFCITFYYELLVAWAWHLLLRDHKVLPVTHTCIHKWNEPRLSLLPSR